LSGYSTLPATVREVKRLNCWKIIPISCRTGASSVSRRPATSKPSTVREPEDTGSSPLIRRTRVDLPAPE
jgi:hypothetical protein